MQSRVVIFSEGSPIYFLFIRTISIFFAAVSWWQGFCMTDKTCKYFISVFPPTTNSGEPRQYKGEPLGNHCNTITFVEHVELLTRRNWYRWKFRQGRCWLHCCFSLIIIIIRFWVFLQRLFFFVEKKKYLNYTKYVFSSYNILACSSIFEKSPSK